MLQVIENGMEYQLIFPYDPELISLIKNVPGRWWEPDKKLWTIPKDNLGRLLNEIKGTKYENAVKLISTENIGKNVALDIKPNIPNVDISKVKLYVQDGSTLYSHQKDFLKFAIYRQQVEKNRSGFLLGDDPGAGKTLQVMNLALYNKSALNFKRCLIITCINSAKYNWCDDIEKHTNGEYIPYLLGTRLKRNGQTKKSVSGDDKLEDLRTLNMYGDAAKGKLPYFIVMNIEAIRQKSGRTYPIADRIIELIQSGEISMIAIDEIHRNASPTSAQGKQLLRIKKFTNTKCMWIPLTGTPIVNRPTDVFLPMRLVDGHHAGSFYEWCKSYCISSGFGITDVIGYKNMPQLQSMLQKNMLRRLKKDILDLPDIIHNIVYVENTSYQSKLYSDVVTGLLKRKAEILASMNPLSQLLRLRQVNGSPELVDPNLTVDSTYLSKNAKLQELLTLLEEIHDRNEKVVIFSNWVEPLRTLYRFIAKKYVTCCFVGTMTEADRLRDKERFIKDPKATVLLGTIGAAGVSHTFTVAQNVIFYDEPWTYADKQQAWERIHRIGTTGPCNCYTLLTRNTVDDRVHDIVYTKRDISNLIVDGKLDIRSNPDILGMLLGETR